MPGSYVIDASNVTLSLGSGAGRVEILRGIGLQVPSGQSVALLGPSGSGKSSLMAVLSGLERASGGSIRIAGEDFTSLGEDALARARQGRIGIVLQAFHLLPTMTALENVAVPLELAGRADAFEIARRELEAVGLGHRLTHYPAQLSGGEQQRVAIARAIVTEPLMILADEPTGALDSKNAAMVLDIFRELQSPARAVVMVTHDLGVAATTERKVSMRDGEIVADERRSLVPTP